MEIVSTNPKDGTFIAAYETLSTGALTGKIENSARAQKSWGLLTLDRRCEYVFRLADVLEAKKDTLARLITDEMGKVIGEARQEIEKCVDCCRYCAENVEKILADKETPTEAIKSFITFRPLGVIFGVMPWNYPFWQVIRFAIPALLTGNGILLKHAHNVTGCSLKLEECFNEAGFPEAVFQSLLVTRADVENIVAHADVCGVALTGSEAAGRTVASLAGKYLKPTVLELGGSDPYIVLDDADLDLAVRVCATARLENAGQTCIAAKRIIVTPGIYEDFAATFEDIFHDFPFGDPLDEQVGMGPMARADLRDVLHKQVLQSLEQGAHLVMGGEIPDDPGSFYPATMLTEVTPGMPVFDDETFGPVIPLIQAKDETDAIRLANQSRYGLGAAVFSADIERAEAIARYQLDAGSCFVNAQVSSSYIAPFGGVKCSGYGRELGDLGFLSFANIKTVYID